MSFTITITQAGRLGKLKPSLADLRKKFGTPYMIGGVGPYFTFQPEAAAPPPGGGAQYMIFGQAGMLGRGFYLMIDAEYSTFQLASQLPTTIHDLEDMVAFAASLAGLLGVDKLVCDDLGEMKVSGLAAAFPEIRLNNCTLLQRRAIEEPGFMVSGVRFPLAIPPAVCTRLAGLPPEKGELFFSDYLADKQRRPYEYMAPQLVRQAEDAPVVAHYSLLEDFATLIPKTPFVPFGASPFGDAPVAEWQVHLMSAKGRELGALPWAAFRQRLHERELTDFDAHYDILRALSQQRLLELLQPVES